MGNSKNVFDAVVIGSGLAGSTVACELAFNGMSVLVAESQKDIALGASGNPVGALIPHLTKTLTRESRFFLHAWNHIQRHQHIISSSMEKTGGLHLAHNQNFADRFDCIIKNPEYQGLAKKVDQNQASQIAGMTLAHGGLFYPDSSLVCPRKFCQLCLSTPGIELNLQSEVYDFNQDTQNKVWYTKARNGRQYISKYIVIANAFEAKKLEITRWLPIYTVRGQIMILPNQYSFKQLKCHISYDGYITPPLIDGRQIIGASFEHWNLDPEINPEQQKDIFSMAKQNIPDLKYTGWNWSDGRVSFRTTSKDRLPIIGRLPDYKYLAERILSDPEFRHTAGLKWPEDVNLPNVYLSLAHASRGVLGCALSARMICDMILNKKSAVEPEVIEFMSASRFLQRQLRKTGSLNFNE